MYKYVFSLKIPQVLCQYIPFQYYREACQPTYMPIHLPTCMPVHQPTCLSTYLSVCPPTYLPVHLPT